MTPQELLDQLGWNYKSSGTDQLNVQECPECHNSDWKFYVNEESGLWDCKVCGATGNGWKLKGYLVSDGLENVVSMKDAAEAKKGPSKIPDLLSMHRQLIESPEMSDILDYLVAERKFTVGIIEQMKLGGYINAEGKKFYMIPYLDPTGTPVYFKGRSLPIEGEKKQFLAPRGHEARLFNEYAIKDEMEELVLVEGEADALSLLSAGYGPVAGVPGANIKKASWIEKLDKCKPKVIYLCYDNDKVGQDAVREIASRIGLDRVRNILLPDFETVGGKQGKDLNEWFCTGKTLADFEELKAQARSFDVEGVHSVAQVLGELRNDIEGRGTQPKYVTPWPSLTMKVGGFEDGDLVGIMAEGKIGKTSLALNLLHYYSMQGYQTFMYCQEMPPKRMVRKWVSHVTQTDDTPGASKMTVESVDLGLQVAGEMPGDILFGYTTMHKPEEVYNTIRQAVRRYGVKVVCFDNLQMMVRSLEHSAQETSKYSKMFKSIAMELGVLTILIIQPNRVADGQIVSARNAMGSSAIEKDVDHMICLHRNRVGAIKADQFQGQMETDSTFEPQMMVKVDLSRYSAGGITTLYMDGATSTVREFCNTDMGPSHPDKQQEMVEV